MPDTVAGTERVARTAALLGVFALGSRLLGLARDMSIAWLLGGGAGADALVAALRLPHVARRLLGDGSLSMPLTAVFVRLGGTEACPGRLRVLFSALNWRLGLVLGLLAAVGLAAAPWLAGALGPGFDVARREAAAELLRLCLPYVPAAGMAALCMALLHSRGIFWLPALSPALLNIVMLAFAAVAALGLVPAAPALALGMTCGGVAQWLAQWALARRQWRGVGEPVGTDAGRELAGEAARCIAALPAGLLGPAVPQLAMLAAMALASGLGAGQVAALYYAERLLELPLGLVGACVGMASLPVLSRLAASGCLERLAAQLAGALRLSLCLSLPAAAGLWAVGPDVVVALLRHGAFDGRAAGETGLALLAYVPGLPAFALSRPLLSACHALGLARAAARGGVTAVIAALAIGGALVHSVPEPWRGMAPALSVSAALWVQCVLLLRASLSACGGQPFLRPLLRAVPRQLAAAACAGLAARLLLEAGRPCGLWPALAAGVAGGVAAWALMLLALRDADALACFRGLMRWLARRRFRSASPNQASKGA